MPQSLHKQSAGAISINTSSQMWAVHSCVCSQRLWLFVTYFCCCSLLEKQLKLLKCHSWVNPTAENLPSCLQNHLWLKNEWILQNPPWKFPDCISPPNQEKNMIRFCLLENAYFSSFVEASSCKFFFWFWGEISRNLVRFSCWCWLWDLRRSWLWFFSVISQQSLSHNLCFSPSVSLSLTACYYTSFLSNRIKGISISEKKTPAVFRESQ